MWSLLKSDTDFHNWYHAPHPPGERNELLVVLTALTAILIYK